MVAMLFLLKSKARDSGIMLNIFIGHLHFEKEEIRGGGEESEEVRFNTSVIQEIKEIF